MAKRERGRGLVALLLVRLLLVGAAPLGGVVAAIASRLALGDARVRSRRAPGAARVRNRLRGLRLDRARVGLLVLLEGLDLRHRRRVVHVAPDVAIVDLVGLQVQLHVALLAAEAALVPRLVRRSAVHLLDGVNRLPATISPQKHQKRMRKSETFEK